MDNSKCIYPTPLPEARCDAKSIFKLCKASLNSEFFISLPNWLTNVKEHSLTYYISIAEEEKMDSFSQGH